MVVSLRFLDGSQQGRVVAIPPQGIGLGCAPDNDVVLPAGQAAPHQARIEHHGDGWTLRGLDDTNAIRLNGGELEREAPLAMGDEIRVGQSRFVFLAVQRSPARADEQTAEGKGPGVFGSGRRRLPGLLLALAALIGLMVAVSLNRETQADAKALVAEAQTRPEDLRVYFEHLKASKDNVYRCELRIEDGVLTAQVADVQSNYYPGPVPGKLSGEDLESLARQLLTPDFLALQSEPASVGRLEDERYRVMVSQGRKGNYFTISNRPLPPAFREVVDVLTNKVQERLAMPVFPPPDFVQEAERMYHVALDEFAKRIVNPSLLNQAARHFTRAATSVEWIEPRPAWYEDAVTKARQATAARDAAVATLLSAAKLAAKRGDWYQADRLRRQVDDLLEREPRIRPYGPVWRLVPPDRPSKELGTAGLPRQATPAR